MNLLGNVLVNKSVAVWQHRNEFLEQFDYCWVPLSFNYACSTKHYNIKMPKTEAKDSIIILSMTLIIRRETFLATTKFKTKWAASSITAVHILEYAMHS